MIPHRSQVYIRPRMETFPNVPENHPVRDIDTHHPIAARDQIVIEERHARDVVTMALIDQPKVVRPTVKEAAVTEITELCRRFDRHPILFESAVRGTAPRGLCVVRSPILAFRVRQGKCEYSDGVRVAADCNQPRLLVHCKTPCTGTDTFTEKRLNARLLYGQRLAHRLCALDQQIESLYVIPADVARICRQQQNLISSQFVDNYVVDGMAHYNRRYVAPRIGIFHHRSKDQRRSSPEGLPGTGRLPDINLLVVCHEEEVASLGQGRLP